jgi:hypothetical protein
VNFDNWLLDQRRYQQETFKVDYPGMASDAGARTDYVSMNMTAAMIEMGEAFQEVPWKPWATINKAESWKRTRAAFIGEIVDVMFFLANALTAVGCTDEELAVRYSQKMTINERRQATAYDGNDKCTNCGRAFDDLAEIAKNDFGANGWTKIQWGTGEKFCCSACESSHRTIVTAGMMGI